MKVAITGTIGAGKSTVARMMQEMGYRVYDMDQWVHELYETDTELLAEIKQVFGEAVFNYNKLDRKALARLVFKDDDKLDKLEAMVFPLVYARLQALIDDGIIVVEVPLLFESKGEAYFDAIIVCDADKELRHKRLTQRGMSPEDIEARERRQFSDAYKREHADYLIDNSADKASLKKQLLALKGELDGKYISMQ